MSNPNPFMPQQPNKLIAPLLVGTVLFGIGVFLISYTKWGDLLVSLGATVVSTGLVYVLLRNFLFRRAKARGSQRQFDTKKRR